MLFPDLEINGVRFATVTGHYAITITGMVDGKDVTTMISGFVMEQYLKECILATRIAHLKELTLEELVNG